jgi:hypothetical protein
MDKAIEARWPPTLKYRPFYLVVKGLASVFISDIGTNMDWARRVYGAQPFVNKTTLPYAAFETAFKTAFPPAIAINVSATATPSYFDAAYVLAYAVAANGGNPVTGPNLSDAIRAKLTPAPMGTPAARQIMVGSDNIFAAFTALGMNDRIDLQGLTGNLDFQKNGDVDQTQEIFCMQTEGDHVSGVKSAGMVFDPSLGMVTGAILNCPGP